MKISIHPQSENLKSKRVKIHMKTVSKTVHPRMEMMKMKRKKMRASQSLRLSQIRDQARSITGSRTLIVNRMRRITQRKKIKMLGELESKVQVRGADSLKEAERMMKQGHCSTKGQAEETELRLETCQTSLI